MGNLIVHQPDSLALALELGRSRTAAFVAGGTGLQADWAKGGDKPKTLISLQNISGLSGFEWLEGSIRIGALTTLGTLERDPAFRAAFPGLVIAIESVAAPTVRNLATLGGNIAGRSGCMLPMLLVLGTELQWASVNGLHSGTLDDWLETPRSETTILLSISIPLPDKDLHWIAEKIGLRQAFTPSLIGVAGTCRIVDGRFEHVRLAVGGGAVKPQRLTPAEVMLCTQSLKSVDWTAFQHALVSVIDAPDDTLSTGAYRRKAAARALTYGLQNAGHKKVAAPFAKAMMPAVIAGERLLSKQMDTSDWHIRPDGPAKINGTFRYLTDHRQDGMLVGRILRAGRPHARILSIDASAAKALPGVAAVVTAKDVKGQNAFGIVIQDQPALCFDKVRYVGDPVAAVAAVNAEIAEQALALIKVAYEDLPVVDDPALALKEEATKVHDTGNLQTQLIFEKGDCDAGFSQAAHIVEATYGTPRQMHGFMETEGGYAFVDETGALTMAVGGQHGARDRLQLSRILDMPEDKIRVITSPTGGAFGGKDELTVQPALALLALKSGKPVRLHLSRAESVMAGTKRNAMTIHMKTACAADGTLLAQKVDVISDCGAYASLSPGVLETALEHACGPYVVPHVKTDGKLAYTNNGVCGAFRGFGANQMTFAIECQMDRLAMACGLDPFEIRRRNMRKPGTTGYLGQKLAPSDRLLDMLKAAEADPLMAETAHISDDGRDIIATGFAMNYQGNGLGTLPPDFASGTIRLAEDGMIEALYGLDEMGQGLITSAQAAVAQAIGCAREDVRVIVGDTALTPDSGSTTASRGGYVVWKIADTCGRDLAQQMTERAAEILELDAARLHSVRGGIAERGSNSGEVLISFAALAERLAGSLPFAQTDFEFPKSDYVKGNARYIYVSGATLARVAISRITGRVRVLDLVQHTAAGPVIDVSAYLGQIEGGAVQGLGFTLSEDATMANGHYLTGNLDSYMMPTIADVPKTMRVYALENLDAGDPYGPRGVGELGIGAVTPAIANAVANGIGIWPEITPFQPEWMLDQMEALHD